MNTIPLTETSPIKHPFSTQNTPSRARTANSPLTHKRLKSTMTKSTINAILQSPSSSIVYEHARHNSDCASPEAMAYANQVWINENKGRRPDEKFMSFIKEIRKTRKASKVHLRKTIKSLRTPDKTPIEVVDAQLTSVKKEDFEKRRKSAGLFEQISANKTKRIVRERNFAQIKQKVDQMLYEDSNPDKIVKYLTKVHIDTSALMQPRFQGYDQSAPGSPSQESRFKPKVDIKGLINQTKQLKVDEEEVLLPASKAMTNLKPENKEEQNKIDIGAVRKYVHISKRSIGSPVMTPANVNLGGTPIQKTKNDRERKRLLKIAQGEARVDESEEEGEEELDSEPVPEFIAQAYAMSMKKSKKVGVNDRIKAGASVEELIRRGEQSGIVADFNLRHQRPFLFSYIRNLDSEFASDKGTPKLSSNSPVDSLRGAFSPISATFRKTRGNIPPSQLLSSLFSARSSNMTPERNNGDGLKRGQSTRAGVEEKPLEIVSIDQTKHKRSGRKELEEREKYLAKVDTYVSPRAIKKSIDSFVNTFYKEKALDEKKSRQEPGTPNYTTFTSKGNNQNIKMKLYNEFQRLTATCAKDAKSSKQIKRVMRKTFGNLKKNFGKMDMLIEERDVAFERQIKKDIKHDMRTYTPTVSALLRTNPSSY